MVEPKKPQSERLPFGGGIRMRFGCHAHVTKCDGNNNMKKERLDGTIKSNRTISCTEAVNASGREHVAVMFLPK